MYNLVVPQNIDTPLITTSLGMSATPSRARSTRCVSLKDTSLWAVIDELVNSCEGSMPAETHVRITVANDSVAYQRQNTEEHFFSMIETKGSIFEETFNDRCVTVGMSEGSHYLGIPIYDSNGSPLAIISLESETPLKVTSDLVCSLDRYGKVIGRVVESSIVHSAPFPSESLSSGGYTICAWTKEVRIGSTWVTIEEFLEDHLGIAMTHGISDDALENLNGTLPASNLTTGNFGEEVAS